MSNVIWFSRHNPTEVQLASLAAMDHAIVRLEAGMELGAVDISTEADVARVTQALRALADGSGATKVFGVFAPPVQQEIGYRPLSGAGAVTCYAAWNTARSVEGGKPTFSHKAWCLVGALPSKVQR